MTDQDVQRIRKSDAYHPQGRGEPDDVARRTYGGMVAVLVLLAAVTFTVAVFVFVMAR